MENMDNFEKLIKAAQRQKADEQRQKKLCAMIDDLAAEEAKSNRRKMWMWIAAAACVVLVASIGLRIGIQNGNEKRILSAEQTVVITDSTIVTDNKDSQQQIEVTEPRIFASTATKKVVREQNLSNLEESVFVAENEPIIENNETEEPVIIVTEATETEEVATEKEDAQKNSAPQKKVYIKMSDKLVTHKSGHGKEKKELYTEPIQLLAFGGTQTSIDFNIDFKK